ncbi:MAG TPA: M55 family metallopeptidase [Acidimicrobiales bacterium]|nr:M55 family metallopeptidase [Acidimicrobiales bacterium]
MDVFISIDLEGVAGVVHTRQTTRGSDDYAAARELMTDEASAAVRGACAAGAGRVVVNDSHGDMANLIPARLDERAELLMGSPKVPQGMLQGLTPAFGVTLFVGYHARAGTESAVLDHTYSGATVYDLRVNGEPWGEIDFNAAVAGAMGVPVGLVTGDQQACAQATDRLGSVETVAVKQAMGRSQGASLHPRVASELIEGAATQAVAAAMSGTLRPYRASPPFVLEVDLVKSSMAEVAALVPGVERSGPRRVTFQSADVAELARCRAVITSLAGSVLY